MQLKHFAVLLSLCSSSLSALTIGEALNENPRTLLRLKQAIKEDPNPGLINRQQETYLHIAARLNLKKSIELLMEVEAIRDLYLDRNTAKRTAIEIAIRENKQAAFDALVKYLEPEDDIREAGRFAGSLLHIAADRNRVLMIKPLINAGVPVNDVDDGGWSALDVARKKHAYKAEKVLLENGAVSAIAKADLDESHDDAPTSQDEQDESEAPQGGVEVDDCCDASDAGCSSKKVLLSLCLATGALACAAICHGVT